MPCRPCTLLQTFKCDNRFAATFTAPGSSGGDLKEREEQDLVYMHRCCLADACAPVPPGNTTAEVQAKLAGLRAPPVRCCFSRRRL